MEKALTKLRDGQPITLVVVGDSNTLVGMNTQGHMNWVGYLTEALWETYGDGLTTVINVSRCGFSYSRLDETLDDMVLRWRPDLVVCQLWLAGSTDGEGTYEEGKQAFRRIAARVTGAAEGGADMVVCTPNPQVLCHGHPAPEGVEPGEVWETPNWNTERNADLVALAREEGCAVVDHFSAWKNKTYTYAHPGANPRGLWQRMIDPIHPNALGHLVMFRELAPLFGVPAVFPWEEIAG